MEKVIIKNVGGFFISAVNIKDCKNNAIEKIAVVEDESYKKLSDDVKNIIKDMLKMMNRGGVINDTILFSETLVINTLSRISKSPILFNVKFVNSFKLTKAIISEPYDIHNKYMSFTGSLEV